MHKSTHRHPPQARIHNLNEIPILACEICEFTSEESISMNLHMETHNHSCKSCSYKTIDSCDLERHVRNMHLLKKYNCNQCDFSTTSKEDFHEHCQSAHVQVQKTRTYFRRLIQNRQPSLLQCNKCSYKPDNQHDLTRHMNTMHKPKPQSKTNVNESVPSTAACSPPSQETSPETSPETDATAAFSCPGSCDSLQNSFTYRDEYDLHLSYFHKTQ